MRLTAKFVVTLVLGMIVVLGINGWVRDRREVGLFESATRRHAHAFGYALGNAVAWAFRTAGEEPALRLVREANEKESDLDVRWVWLGPGVTDGMDERYRPRLPLGELEPLLRGQEVSRRLPSESGPGELLTYVPVSLPGGRTGALQIGESLQAQHEVRATVLRTVVVSVLALIGVTALLASILGALVVGRPARALVQQAHRIGTGDLGARLSLRQRDELGEIADEMNRMCEQLALARSRAAEESSSRIAAMEQLRHADRLMTVGKLASGIAHELGTPLNVVSGRAQMIAAGESEGQEARDGARIIVEQGKRMTQIIRQLLDFARPRKTQKAGVDLSRVAAQTVALLEPMAKKRGLTMSMIAATEPRSDGNGEVAPPPAHADEGQIQQVLMNLLVNAIHATPSGGAVKVGCALAPATPPADHGGATRAWLRVDVVDTGCGMDEATAARALEPFFTTKEVGEGTGLGLSVAYGIVKEHGGWLEVRSAPGRGSTFSIYLPPAPQKEEPAEAQGGGEQARA